MENENAGLQAEIDSIRQQNADLAARLTALEQAAGTRSTPTTSSVVPALLGAVVVLLAMGLGLGCIALLRRGGARRVS